MAQQTPSRANPHNPLAAGPQQLSSLTILRAYQRNPSGVGLPLCECGPIGPYKATAGLSTSSHHWRKLVGVEFCGVRGTPLSRPSFLAQARSAYP